MSRYQEIQEDFIGIDHEVKGEKWETLPPTRVSFEEKRDVMIHCKTVLRLTYAVVTRLIWRKILHNYRIMPNLQGNAVDEIEKSVDEVLEYIPVIRRQKTINPREF